MISSHIKSSAIMARVASSRQHHPALAVVLAILLFHLFSLDPIVSAWSATETTHQQGVIGTPQPAVAAGQHYYDDVACSQENVDFYLSGRWARAVIPLSNDCIQQHQTEKLQFPGNSTVLLKGLPKMGTTWTEVLTIRLIESVCASGLYDCAASAEFGRGAVAAFDSNTSAGTAVLRFSAAGKHSMPAGKTCGPNCWRPDLATKMFKKPQQNKWERCVQKRKYRQFHECVVKWAGEPFEKWSDIWIQGANHIHANFTGGHRKQSRLQGAGNNHASAAAAPVNLIKKYIMVMRDPRDSIVSFIHYHHEFAPKNSKQLIADVRKIFPHYVAWQGLWYYYQFWHVSKHWPTLRLLYRDMSNDPAREYERVLDYIGLKASVDTLQAVVAETSFSSMQHMEESKALPGRNKPNSDLAKVRSGEAGGFVHVLDAETIQFCNSIMLDKLPPELNAIFGVQ